MVLQYADITFRANKDFVKVAALQDPLAFEFAADNVKADKDFILDLLRTGNQMHNDMWHALRAFVSETVRNGSGFMSKVLELTGERKAATEFASDKLRTSTLAATCCLPCHI